MPPHATPLDLYRTTLAYWSLMAEAQAVIGYRMLGMAGLWAVTGSETDRMLAEKAPAFAEAMRHGGRAMIEGRRPDQIALAAMQPLGRKAAANRRRLARRGPKLGF
ncbi:hypothetical protein [Limimaricola pyoseonensis]|uniref:Antifreeze protein n=1 Tax=Limimaricola pyoseonensis TaxID=521013 RepID=A0A1G7G5M2_9RHOB|nr:hypothetical protein [Limimaricola pyoseonensis]SDE83456.1 hypothetical protein SAMN04488567_2735 [Limimaricola pyoseonensis]